MLVYSQNWVAGSSELDLSIDQYSDSSFTSAPAKGQTMSFGFYGTSVTVFGAKRPGHGSYMPMMDNIVAPTLFNGASTPPQFKQVLFTTTVAKAAHNLTIVNGDGTLDVDYVAFNTSIGTDNEALIVNSFQDLHPSFTYTPSSLWAVPPSAGTFSGGSLHMTSSPSASLQFSFQGDTVAVYGPVGPGFTPSFSVQVDNGTPSFYSAQKQLFRSEQVLFYSAGLGAGQHSIKIGPGAPGQLAIDYANVYTTPSLGGSFIGAPAPRSMPMGAVAALAITTTLAILASLLSVYLFWRQRREIIEYATPVPNSANSKFVLPFEIGPVAERSMGRRASNTSSQASTQDRTSMYAGSVTSSSDLLGGGSLVVEGHDSRSRVVSGSQIMHPLPPVPDNGRTWYQGRDTKSGFHLTVDQSSSSSGSQYMAPVTAGGQPPPEYTASPNSNPPPLPTSTGFDSPSTSYGHS